MATSPLFEMLNDLNSGKKDLLSSANEKQYIPFVINRFVGGSLDCLYYAIQMNQVPESSKRLQYDYYLYLIPKRKRYVKWIKAAEEKRLELIKEYYGYSRKKCKEILPILAESDFDFMETYLDKGGQKGNKKNPDK